MRGEALVITRRGRPVARLVPIETGQRVLTPAQHATVDGSVERPCVLTLQALAGFVFAVTRKEPVPRREAAADGRSFDAACSAM